MSGVLKVIGNMITRDGEPIVLKGSSLGGWMTMENFINGYPGHEHQFREGLRDVLGAEKSDYFFDKFLEYWFTEEDAKLFASFGFNSIRLPVNYRHFEDDMNPRVIKEAGYKHLDRVVELCARHGIYSIIDLHTAPGGQNQGWHCDSGISHSTFWSHRDFQDRAINLWEHFAKHFRGNPWVAGFNPLNEPADEKNYRLLDWYVRVEKAIRAIDPDHILFLDTYGADFRAFAERPPLPNTVYTCHDYSAYGFPNPPELFKNTPQQTRYHEGNFARKSAFMRDINGPIWVGEFGPVYAFPQDGLTNWQEINDGRYDVAKNQIDIYRKNNASWSIWLYKDIGFQGIVRVREDTPWMKLVGPANERKKRLAGDQWGVDDKDVRYLFDPIVEWLTQTVPGYKDRYPRIWKPTRHVSKLLREQLLSEELLKEYVELFRGKTKEELHGLAKSFLLENCEQRDRLCKILADDATKPAFEWGLREQDTTEVHTEKAAATY